MNTLSAILVLVVAALLAISSFLFIRLYEIRSGSDDTLNELIRTRNELSASEDAIKRIHIMYQNELGKQRDMFCRYWAEKKKEGDG